MDRPQVFLRRAVLVLVAISGAIAENRKEYFTVGGSIKLSLEPPATQQINRIVWKHDANLLAEWTDGEFSFYDRFEIRTTLDKNTAFLEITNAQSGDSGRFEVEVNNKVQELVYDVKVIQKVSKPNVWVKPLNCGPTSKTCTLTCEGATPQAQPITYSWRFDDQTWWQGDPKQVITNDTAGFKTVSCLMENPVSREVSDIIQNPLWKSIEPTKPGPGVGHWVGLGVGLVVLLCLGLLWYFEREKIKSFFARFTENRGPENGGPPPTDNPGNSLAGEDVPLKEEGPPAGDQTTPLPPGHAATLDEQWSQLYIKAEVVKKRWMWGKKVLLKITGN